MSALGKPTTAPVEAPPRISPVPAPPPPRKVRPWKLWAVLVILAAAGGWAAYSLLLKPQQAPQPVMTGVPTATVAVGSLEQVVRLAGQTAATNFASITVPVMQGPEAQRDMTLVELADAGAFVRRGDQIARIEAQGAEDHIDDVASMVARATADIRKRQAEQMVDWENLQQTLRMAQAQVSTTKLDLSAAEVRTPIDQELLKLFAEEADGRRGQLQHEIGLKQAVYSAELRILEIAKIRHDRHLQRHVNDLERFTFYAPMDGLVVMQTTFRGGEMAQTGLGDQVRTGQTFMRIVDTSNMQVEAEANQADSDDLRVGQRATVRLDAFPDLELQGRIHSLGAMAVRSWRENYYIRTIPVRIAIEGSDPRLIPDLSASADVVVRRKEDGPIIPIEAVQHEQGGSFVFVKKDDRFERRDVELGPRNATLVAVLAGLQAGEEVALEPPPTI